MKTGTTGKEPEVFIEHISRASISLKITQMM
jgi:hypothetical protein